MSEKELMILMKKLLNKKTSGNKKKPIQLLLVKNEINDC